MLIFAKVAFEQTTRLLEHRSKEEMSGGGTFGENQTEHICTNTSYQLSSTVVRPSAKSWLKLGHASVQQSQTQQQICKRMSEKESTCCNDSVKVRTLT